MITHFYSKQFHLYLNHTAPYPNWQIWLWWDVIWTTYKITYKLKKNFQNLFFRTKLQPVLNSTVHCWVYISYSLLFVYQLFYRLVVIWTYRLTLWEERQQNNASWKRFSRFLTEALFPNLNCLRRKSKTFLYYHTKKQILQNKVNYNINK